MVMERVKRPLSRLARPCWKYGFAYSLEQGFVTGQNRKGETRNIAKKTLAADWPQTTVHVITQPFLESEF